MQILISAFYFFYFAIVGIYVIFLPKVLSMLGYSGVEIGIVFATAPLVRFLVPFAFIKGMKLNKKAFNSALLIIVVSSVLFYAALHNFYALVFTNILFGIGLSLLLPYVEVIALSVITKERYGKVRLFGSIGFIVVALVLVKYLSGVDIAVFYLIFMSVMTAIFGYLVAKNESGESEDTDTSQSGNINIFSHWSLWAGLTLMQVSFGPFYNFFTIYETDHGIGMDMTIYLWSFGVVMEVFMLFFQGRLLQKNLLGILQFTTFMTALRWLLLFLFPQSLAVSFFTQSIHALSFALFHSAAISYLFTLYKKRKLAQQFFLGITYGLGGFTGALYSGYVYEYFSTYLFLSSAFVAFTAFLFVRHEAKKTAYAS
ncbi:MFS transporter [Sulfurimonas sp. HSL-1716]|uniref:MFS transporter n=1 Tax=Hydrocurvibacter sulfurireducens TaxID=3131937 RepID=UPI0031F93CB6